ncbi:hypothetical protein [Solimonas sp. SE-A11]|uniref:hypothetical protein n=1 Tax=Solimonas sp. SE-A11 TaxID=3054954 RepID=UPI00259CF11A|nr:hypothetical protein [Solimonas sp. SE-A11]MDM4771422.1 hypothetical protein [Solimonas sp. SE-A11]
MFARLAPILLSLCLLAGLSGLGPHVHRHAHGHDEAHSYVVSALDIDHAQAHAEGSQDDDSNKLGTRVSLDLPQLGPAPSAVLSIDVDGVPGLLPLLAEQRVTGPPRFLLPPSQAPPQAFSTV